jgi:predicted DNA-binding transcriptional regulator YafY
VVSDVEPWAVVVRHGRWHLLCRTHPKDTRRAHRVDRVRTVEVLDDTFNPPADLDPITMIEEHLAVGWEYDIEVVIDAPLDTANRRPATRRRPPHRDRRPRRLPPHPRRRWPGTSMSASTAR